MSIAIQFFGTTVGTGMNPAFIRGLFNNLHTVHKKGTKIESSTYRYYIIYMNYSHRVYRTEYLLKSGFELIFKKLDIPCTGGYRYRY